MRHLDKLRLDRISVARSDSPQTDPSLVPPRGVSELNSVNVLLVRHIFSLTHVNIVMHVVSVVSVRSEALDHMIVPSDKLVYQFFWLVEPP